MAHSADGVPSKLPKGVDASTFFSPVIPDDIRSSFKLLHEHPAEVYAPFVKVVAQYLAEGDGMMIPTALYDRTESATGMSTNDINMLLSAIFLIVRSAIRSKSKVSVVRRDLAETMLLPAQFVEQICAALVKFRTPLERHVLVNRIHHAKLEKIRWRLDVTISSGSLSRIMRPNILMQVGINHATLVYFLLFTEFIMLYEYVSFCSPDTNYVLLLLQISSSI